MVYGDLMMISGDLVVIWWWFGGDFSGETNMGYIPQSEIRDRHNFLVDSERAKGP